MREDKPYHYVRFTSWHNHNPTELVERLKKDFISMLKR